MTSTPGLHPVDGAGVLSRHGALVVLCSLGSEELVDVVLAAHEEVAHAHGDATALADRLGEVLAGSAAGLDVVVFGPSGASVLVGVFGHAWADVTTEYGEQRLALRQSRDGVRSVLPGTLLTIRAGLGDVDTSAVAQRFGNLEHGTVHAGGLLFVTAGAQARPDPPAPFDAVAAHVSDPTTEHPVVAPSPVPAPPAPAPEPPAPAPPAPPAPVPPAPAPTPAPSGPVPPVAEPPVVEPPAASVDRSQPFASVVLLGAADSTPQTEDRLPLPIAAPPAPVAPEVAPPAHPVDDRSVQVLGVYCKNGHFDDPSARYCAICGISMAQLTLVPRPGPRPPLGVLVLDDGSIFSLDADYVIGRDPSRNPDVGSGAARPMRVADPQGSISRAHLRIKLDGWQVEVLDLGSANGTGVRGPGDGTWQPVPKMTPVPIRPGTEVGFGRRQLRYESHRNT